MRQALPLGIHWWKSNLTDQPERNDEGESRKAMVRSKAWNFPIDIHQQIY